MAGRNRYIMPEKRMNVFIKAAIVVFVCFCVASIIGQQYEYNELCNEQDKLESQIEEREYDIEEMSELLDHEVDYEYVKQIARKSLGYHMPDEVIYYNDLKK